MIQDKMRQIRGIRQILLCIIIALGVLFLGCKEKDISQVIAQVGDVKLRMNDLKASVPSKIYPTLSYDQKLEFIRQWVDRETLKQAAIEKKLDQTTDVKRQMKINQQMILSEAMKQFAMNEIDFPQEGVLKSFLRSNKKNYLRKKDSWNYLLISTKSGKLAWDLYKTATQGKIDPHLSWISKNKSYSLEEFEFSRPTNNCLLNHMVKQKENRLSVPVICNKIYRIFYIRDKQLIGEPYFYNEIQERIQGDFINMERQRREGEIVKKEKALRLIKVWPELLK